MGIPSDLVEINPWGILRIFILQAMYLIPAMMWLRLAVARAGTPPVH